MFVGNSSYYMISVYHLVDLYFLILVLVLQKFACKQVLEWSINDVCYNESDEDFPFVG